MIKQQIGFDFTKVLMKDGLKEARAFYNRVKGDSIQRNYYLWDEEDAAMTYPAYLLLEQKMSDLAVEIFKFNVELYPQSPYAYSHLAMGYKASGDKDSARLNFQKAIELAPQDKYFKDELKKLEDEAQTK